MPNFPRDDQHDEAHTVDSHSDTTATGAELETLTNGSNADLLHTHVSAGGSVTTLKEGGSQVGDADIEILDFGAGFDLVESPDKEINITLDLSEISAGGELGGTLDAPTVDATHSGSAHHTESHTAASHSDQGATGAELETLTDGSNADALHVHAGGASGASIMTRVWMGV
jgi:hypothetical protein